VNQYALRCGNYLDGRCIKWERTRGHRVDDSNSSRFYCNACLNGMLRVMRLEYDEKLNRLIPFKLEEGEQRFLYE
jgi:hypothetical protein